MADVTAPQFQQDVNNTAEWANGDENTTVTMRLGQEAKSPAKVISDIQANFDATQAGELTAQAVDAANRAETSANFAMTAGWVYGSVADGEAARVDGEHFWVVSADDLEVLELWEMGVSNATDTGKRTASKFALDSLSTQVAGFQSELISIDEDAKNNLGQLDAVLFDAITGNAERTNNTTDGLIYPPETSEKYLVRPYLKGVDRYAVVKPLSAKITGKNIVNPSLSLWESGLYDSSGNKVASGSRTRTTGIIPIKPDFLYSSNLKVVVTLFDEFGVFTRQLTLPQSFTTTAVETGMALYYIDNIENLPPSLKQIQIEIGGSTPFERYQELNQYYDPAIELRSAGVHFDEIVDGQLIKNIEQRTIEGSLISTNVITTGDYYRATLPQAQAQSLLDNIGTVENADGADGSYLITDSPALEDRAIYLTRSIGYIRVLKTVIDSVAAGTTYINFLTYLNTNPITLTMSLGTPETSYAGDGALIVPPKGTVTVNQSGSTDYAVDFLPISVNGGGGSTGLDTRVQQAENDIVQLTAKDADLQNQIDTLVVGGDSSTEAAQARTSIVGYTTATLKARLDKMDTRNAVYVTDFAALTGDDTEMFEAARDFAEANKLDLVIPPRATPYELYRGVCINESILVLGMMGHEIIKTAAFTTNVSAAIDIGDTVIPVDDATGFTVGHDVMIGNPATDSYANTIGKIIAVDTGANTITIEAYKSAGMNTAFASGAVASSTFAMFYTNKTLNPSVKITPKFVGLNLDGNKQFNEPESYPMSPIFIDSSHSEVPVVKYCTVRNSSADGISDQSDGGGYLKYNRVFDCNVHGLHMGFTNNADKIYGNYVEGCGKSGYYWCFGVTDCMATNNIAKNCFHGFYEIDGNDVRALLTGNITIDCNIDYDLRGGNEQANILNFISVRSKSRVVSADTTTRFKIQGMAVDGESIGVELMRSSWGQVDVDFYRWTGSYCVNVRNLNAIRSSKIRISGNFEGATVAPVRIISSDRCVITGAIFETSAPQDILIQTDGAQAACDGTVIGIVSLDKGINDGGTNTKVYS